MNLGFDRIIFNLFYISYLRETKKMKSINLLVLLLLLKNILFKILINLLFIIYKSFCFYKISLGNGLIYIYALISI